LGGGGGDSCGPSLPHQSAQRLRRRTGIGVFLAGLAGLSALHLTDSPATWAIQPAQPSSSVDTDEAVHVVWPELQFRIAEPDGTFLALRASVPDERPRPRPGYVAIWVDYDAGRVFIYDRRLESVADLGHALYNLAADLNVDLLGLASEHPMLNRALTGAAAQDEDPTLWLPATRRRVLRVMDFDLPGDQPQGSSARMAPIQATLCNQPVFDTGDPEADPEEEIPPDDFTACCVDLLGTPIPCEPCSGSCCDGGCGGGPPDPDPCEGSTDPCCGVDCDDGDPCTDDSCVDGGCIHTPKDCDDGDPCTDDDCDPMTGECTHTEMPHPNDFDCDGIPDDQDTDDDNDGINDDDENAGCEKNPDPCCGVVCNDGDVCTNDSCNPATGNCVFTPIAGCVDTDNDGIPDDQENPGCENNADPCCGDADCDGIPDGSDPDDDNDGIPDDQENPGCATNPDPCCGDADCDGTPDGQDPDDDNDGINDEDENSGCETNPNPCCGDADCDNDGIPDDLDPDDDNDGINDEDENPGCSTDPDPCCGVSIVIDLDVDSNNDGTIDPDNCSTGTDDPIEPGIFMPNPDVAPGKVGWINQNDSDGDGAADNLNSIIDGPNDLEDIGELIIRPYDLSPLESSLLEYRNPRLFLRVSDPGIVRVFASRSGNAPAVLDPNFDPLGDVPIVDLTSDFGVGQGGATLGMEGVGVGTTEIALVLIADRARPGGGILGPGEFVASDVVRVTVMELDVTWLDSSGIEITDPNNHPSGTLGLQYFPGSTAAGGTWNDVVQVFVRPNPPVANVLIFLKAFDPDDPSADNNVVDGLMGGGDNRDASHLDTGSLGATQITTNALGVASTTFRVAHQPGDNHRIAATMKQSALTMLNDDNVPPSNTFPPTVDEVPFFIGKLSPLLTVWRTLHVETDAMTRPAFSQNTINTTWNEPRFQQGFLVLDISNQDNNDDFTNGFIRIKAAGFPDIVTRIILFEHSFLDDEVTTVVTPQQWAARPASGDCTISDDDLTDDPPNALNFTGGVVGSDIGINPPPGGYLPLPDTSGLAGHYAPAYILPVVENQHTSTTGIPFLKNMEPSDNTQWDAARLSRGLSIPVDVYWTVYVFSAFQAEDSEDADGEDTATKGINTHPDGSTTEPLLWSSTYRAMVAIFKEALDDAYGATSERITVAHEIAHTLGVPHGTGLMGETTQTNAFSLDSLVELRSYNGP